MKRAFITTGVFLVLVLLTFIISCKRSTSPAEPNTPPNTTVANIPVDSSLIFALATLHWDGEDDDGFIAGYQYRYTTEHLNAGDTYEQDWIETSETSLTIAFESSDELNFQTFQVRAVDNDGEVDPTPAEKKFFTKKTIPPRTTILIPENNEIFFAREIVTDWWPGIRLTFNAQDEDGAVVEYAWAVDNGEWNWTQDTTLYIKPEFFSSIQGAHKIRVISRDNTNIIDPKGDSVIVNLINPSFDKPILIIDETDEELFPDEEKPTDEDVDNFYAEAFGVDETWDFKKDGMPSKEVLSRYQLVIWHADNPYTTDNDIHKLPLHILDIMDYMNVGGDFIMSGWRILKCFADKDPFLRTFEEGEFIHDYLHITEVDETVLFGDFTGAGGVGGFSDIEVNPDKIVSFPYLGKLAQVNLMPGIAGFTDKMFLYKNDPSSSFDEYRSQTVGLRYYGSVFDAAVFGFPIYFLKTEDAKIMATEILNSMGY